MRSGRERTLAEGGRKNRGGGEAGEGAGGKKETLHNKNALNYRMKPSSNCVIRLFLSTSRLTLKGYLESLLEWNKWGPTLTLSPSLPVRVCRLFWSEVMCRWKGNEMITLLDVVVTGFTNHRQWPCTPDSPIIPNHSSWGQTRATQPHLSTPAVVLPRQGPTSCWTYAVFV